MTQEKTDETSKNTEQEAPKSKRGTRQRFKIALGVIGALLLLPLSYAGYVYAVSPAVIRDPKLEHYHFRMQILVNGKAEDFSRKAYQTGYAKDQCNANLPEQPIHFHDNKDQFTHIHWEGMTGGMVMKYYGWNYIGGISNALGYKLDKLSDPQKVTTHGNYLPTVPKDATFYVYTGDENSYKERSFNDWKTQDLETFFGTTSNFPAHDINKGKHTSMLDKVFPKAYAHGTANDEDGNDGAAKPETEQEKLSRINNLVGNVVIFVQKDKPTDQQIKDRFNKLLPLDDSTCGG
jgi:hypothetical protein